MSLHTLFAPKSVAVIGASTTPGSVGNDVAKNLVESDYTGDVFLINPKTDTLLGRPCYPALEAVPGTVELAIIIVPAKIVPAVLREAGERMVRAAVIISAGFKESGPVGQALEKEIIAIAAEHHITLLGPNCLGFINPSIYLNASFASTLPAKGSIAFFSQSGALTSAFLDLTRGKIGFSLFASIGNKAALREQALLDYLLSDDATRTIGFYSENLDDASSLIALGRKNAGHQKPKPIIALKSGATAAGTSASSSHTGAVAGSDSAYDALFKQSKMLRAKSFEELTDFLAVMSMNPLPTGNRVAIVTNAGGLGVLATDAAIQNGLTLAVLTPETVTALQASLPPAANTHNPIDVLGDALADRYAKALRLVAADAGVDSLLIILTPQTMTEAAKTAEAIVALRKEFPSLAIVTVFSGASLVAPGHAVLTAGHIPNILYPENSARALGALTHFSESHRTLRDEEPTHFTVKREKVAELFTEARKNNQLQLGEYPAAACLKHYGFPYLKSELVTSREAALDFAARIAAPIVLKIASPDIIHKTEVGGVILHVKPEEADVAYEHLLGSVHVRAPHARIEGAVASEMAKSDGLELLLGLKDEPGLGTLVVVGLGGIYVETFKDISMRFAPLLPSDIDEMLGELQSLPLLMGARGGKPMDLARLKEYLARLSQLAIDFPEIAELDINPLLVFPEGDDFRILDSRIRLKELPREK